MEVIWDPNQPLMEFKHVTGGVIYLEMSRVIPGIDRHVSDGRALIVALTYLMGVFLLSIPFQRVSVDLVKAKTDSTPDGVRSKHPLSFIFSGYSEHVARNSLKRPH